MQKKTETATGYSFPIMAVHLFTLFVFVVGRPIFTILADHPEYLVANQMRAADIYIAVVLLVFVIPLILTCLVAVAGIFGSRFRLLVQTVFCAGMVSVFALHLIGEFKAINDVWRILFSALCFVIFAILYYKQSKISQIITALSPVVLLFPALFLFDPEIKQLLQSEIEATGFETESGTPAPAYKPPIVMVVFDELSLVDLLDADGQVDIGRFPNFAALSSIATWYKNATTVSYATQVAVPAILSGRLPVSRKLPIFSQYTHNLFSLLDGHYSFHVVEPITRLFHSMQSNGTPESAKLPGVSRSAVFLSDMSLVYLHIVLPGKLSVLLPVIDEQWGGFLPVSIFRPDQQNRTKKAMTSDRVQPMESFISDISAYPEETVHFIHLMLPHRPLQYLPSGRIYTDKNSVKGISFTREKGSKVLHGPQVLTDRLHQNQLLQTAFADELLGRLISKMKSAGIYNEALLIVVADHGISYQRNLPIRYPVRENYGEVAFVPLFIKYPSQDQAREIESNAETIDILPTIIDVLDMDTDWKFDGQSLLEDSRSEHEKKIFMFNSKQPYLVYDEDAYLSARQAALEKNTLRFDLTDSRSNLFDYGLGLDFVGTRVDQWSDERVPCSVQSDQTRQLGMVDLSDSLLPTEIVGEIDCADVDLDQLLIVAAVNGVVRGVTQPFSYKEEKLFNLILSDQLFRDGRNEVEVFVIRKKHKVKR